MKNHAYILASLAGLAVGSAASGQTASVVLINGQQVGSVGLATTIDNVAVNNSGVWLVEAYTDNANTAIDQVMVKSGVVVFQQGDARAAPGGATISSFDSVKGPSITVTFPSESRTRLTFELGWSPLVATSTPAFATSSMNLPISSISSGLGGTPASDSSSARYQLYYGVGAIWLFQLVTSPIWLRYYRLGPVEWLRRSLTYGTRQPMRVSAAAR